MGVGLGGLVNACNTSAGTLVRASCVCVCVCGECYE